MFAGRQRVEQFQEALAKAGRVAASRSRAAQQAATKSSSSNNSRPLIATNAMMAHQSTRQTKLLAQAQSKQQAASNQQAPSEKVSPEIAKCYDEIDQIYDYIRGLAPLPSQLRKLKSIDFEQLEREKRLHLGAIEKLKQQTEQQATSTNGPASSQFYPQQERRPQQQHQASSAQASAGRDRRIATLRSYLVRHYQHPTVQVPKVTQLAAPVAAAAATKQQQQPSMVLSQPQECQQQQRRSPAHSPDLKGGVARVQNVERARQRQPEAAAQKLTSEAGEQQAAPQQAASSLKKVPKLSKQSHLLSRPLPKPPATNKQQQQQQNASEQNTNTLSSYLVRHYQHPTVQVPRVTNLVSGRLGVARLADSPSRQSNLQRTGATSSALMLVNASHAHSGSSSPPGSTSADGSSSSSSSSSYQVITRRPTSRSTGAASANDSQQARRPPAPLQLGGSLPRKSINREFVNKPSVETSSSGVLPLSTNKRHSQLLNRPLPKPPQLSSKTPPTVDCASPPRGLLELVARECEFLDADNDDDSRQTPPKDPLKLATLNARQVRHYQHPAVQVAKVPGLIKGGA